MVLEGFLVLLAAFVGMCSLPLIAIRACSMLLLSHLPGKYLC